MSENESKIANTISNAFVSSNDVHAITGITNMVDAIEEVADSLLSIKDSIRGDAAPGKDSSGGHVGCVIEAIMGINAGLVEIAGSISDLANAVREKNG